MTTSFTKFMMITLVVFVTSCQLADNRVNGSIKVTQGPVANIEVPGINLSNYLSFSLSGVCAEDGQIVVIDVNDGAMLFEDVCSGGAWGIIIDFSALPDGLVSLKISYKDSAVPPEVVSIVKDIDPPTNPLTEINGDAPFTNSTTVTITPAVDGGASQIYLTQTPGCAGGGEWQDFSGDVSFLLTDLTPPVTVYTKYRDAAGNETSCVSDIIGFDNIIPQPATAPVAGSIGSETQSPAITWTDGSDADSGLSHHEVSIYDSSNDALVVDWTSAVSGDKISGTFVDGNDYYAVIRAVDHAGNVSSSIQTGNWTASKCPSGYIKVPADGSYVTQDFCVMKYEAKLLYDTDDDGDFSDESVRSDGNAGNTYNYDTLYESSSDRFKPVSVAAGWPWVYIKRGENGGSVGQGAIEACQSLGVGYDLISNDEWQAIAVNIYGQQSGPTNNWGLDSGQVVINRGHADGAPGTPLVADPDDNNGCAYTGQETAPGSDRTCPGGFVMEKRTHNLSNGEIIWDLAGNVNEFTRDVVVTNFGLGAGGHAWSTLTDGNSDGVSDSLPTEQLTFGPPDLTPAVCTVPGGSHRCGFGAIWETPANGAIFRGGNWGSQTSSGIFAIEWASVTGGAAAQNYMGFRCVYH
ncbi:MAG: hypothetical protein H6626_13950 [Pseudobdellovibrionaceae bacterium]|nr:MAG: hypothetical protein H6626_13950 [Pseudobdellovibrionaceae bacterium]